MWQDALNERIMWWVCLSAHRFHLWNYWMDFIKIGTRNL